LINQIERGILMEKVIASIVIIVLTLGLISYAVIGQMSGFRDTSDIVSADQTRLNMMINDSSLVSKNTVKYYIKNAALLGIKVYLDDSQQEATMDDIDKVSDTALYRMTKTYKEDGSLKEILFVIESQATA